MWEELLSIRHLVHVLGLFKLNPEYVSREDDLHAVQAHHAQNPRHPEEDSVVLSNASMAGTLAPMRRWLTRLRWVDQFQESFEEFRGTNWTIIKQNKMIYGEGGFRKTYTHITEMHWNSSEDTAQVSSLGLRLVQLFAERSKD